MMQPPRKHRLCIYNKKSPTNEAFYKMAGELGFEPRLAESESAVLPLDDSPKFSGGLYINCPKDSNHVAKICRKVNSDR